MTLGSAKSSGSLGASKVTDNQIAAAPYFTDASALMTALGSPPTVIIGPGELALAHQTDEYCLVSRLEKATEMYAQIVRDWCHL